MELAIRKTNEKEEVKGKMRNELEAQKKLRSSRWGVATHTYQLPYLLEQERDQRAEGLSSPPSPTHIQAATTFSANTEDERSSASGSFISPQ